MELLLFALEYPILAVIAVLLVAGLFAGIVAARPSPFGSGRRSLREPRARAPRSLGPQVAGFPCVKCGVRILFDSEAAPCDRCGRPAHLGCLPHAHEPGMAPPYRS